MTYMIFDLETTVAERYRRKANAFIDDNWCVAEGWKVQGDAHASYRYMDEATSRSSFLAIPDNVDVLVGVNVKFDLLWELSRTNTDLERFLKRGGKIFCCQYAEYLLRAQHPKWHMCSMNDMITALGGEPKIDIIKELWNDGVNTPDIPKDLLIDYLVGTVEEGRNGGDIGKTEEIYLDQIKRAEDTGMTRVIEDRMDGLLGTAFMEFYGLNVDTRFAKEYLAKQKAALEVATGKLHSFIPKLPPELTFNWNSNAHKSALIFGGAIKYKKQMRYKDKDGEWARKNEVEKWPLFYGVPTNPKDWVDGMVPDTYKGGKRLGDVKTKNVTVKGEYKTRYEDLVFDFKGYTTPDPKWQGSLTDARGNPQYGTGSDVVDALSRRGGVPFLEVLGRFSALTKEIGTYLVVRDPKSGKLKGMLTCVDPKTTLIHHKLNHTNTVTSRLSSSDPNLQNLPRGDKSEVKQMFNSRFPDGAVVEADYSQLEVVVQGVLTGDKNLCSDLRDRVDFHCKRVATARGCTYEEALEWCKNENSPKYKEWKVYRQQAKIFSFQRAYGAGAKLISESAGMDIEDVEALIEAEEAMYPAVEAYYKRVEEDIAATAKPIRALRDNGSYGVYRRGHHTVPTGTRYSWRSYDAPEFLKRRGVVDTFSPPEIRNYPVQGTGGEFVQCVVGLAIRQMIAKDFYGTGMYDPQAVLINTVHDSIWADCASDELAVQMAGDLKAVMESIPQYYNDTYGMNISVPFPVDIEMGKDMNNLHPVS